MSLLNPRVTKIVLVIQDLETKDKHKIAVVSGDVHLYTPEGEEKRKPISFQMALDTNKEFQRCIKDLTTEALMLHEKKHG